MALTKALGGSGGGGSSLTVKDEGSTLTTAATSIDFVGGGVTATNVGGAVTATIPTQTPSGIIIGRDGSNSTSTVNPHAASQVAIANMSASFTLAATSDIAIDVSVRAWKSGGAVLTVWLDGSLLGPTTGGGSDPPNEGYYMVSGSAGERSNLQAAFTYIAYSVASGSHTIVIRSEASQNTNSISYGERCVIVRLLG